MTQDRTNQRADTHETIILMAEMWVGGPEARNPERLRALEAEGARVMAEARALQAGDEATCRICGSRENLTDEHAPSMKAGNVNSGLVRGMVDDEATMATGEVAWKAQRLQGGAKGATLCGQCNNTTGSWYNPAYIRLVDQCRPYAIPERAGTSCDITFDLHPQRAAKQALTSVLATSQAGVAARHPHLRALIVGKEAAVSITPLHLWLYLQANPGGRSTGVAAWMNLERGVGRIVAEFSFWPLGWALTFDDAPVEGALDMSSWFEIGYHDQSKFTCAVPCQWALMAYPLDFRSPEAIMADRAKRQR